MSVRNTVGLAVGAVAFVAVPAFGLGGIAGAATGEGGEGRGRGPRAELTEEQRECLADQGVTPPEKPPEGAEPSERPRLTDEQRAAFKVAAEACGLPAPPARGPRPRLTDEQRQCLADQGVSLPERPPEGAERPRPTEAQRTAMKAAAEACGIPARERPPGGSGAGALAA